MKRPGIPKRKTYLRSRGSSLPAGRGPIDRRRKVRTRSEFARIYGSKARVAWVKAQPCIAWTLGAWPLRQEGCRGPMQNAHTANGGVGRKADAETIVPACTLHHDEMHRGIATFSAKYALDLPALAARTQRRWAATQEAA